MTTTKDTPIERAEPMSRRKMLMRLGLVAGAIYAAPSMLQLGEAKASSLSGRRGGRRSFSGSRRTNRPRRSFSR